MPHIIVHRTFEETPSADVLAALSEQESRAPGHLRTYMALDATRLASVYEGADTGAAQAVLDGAVGQLGAPEVWHALSFNETMGRQAPQVTEDQCIVVLDRVFPSGTTAERLSDGITSNRLCLDTYEAVPVESYLRVDRKASMCIFAAPDAESVRLAMRRLEVPVVRAWTAATLRHA